MKKRLWFIAFFIVVTITTALHALDHPQEHNGNSCQICILDDHTVSADIIPEPKEPLDLHSGEPLRFAPRLRVATAKYYAPNRAPPLS